MKNTPLRRRDLVTIKLVDWSKDKDEPAYDVEIYKKGVFNSKLSKIFSTKEDKDIAYSKAKRYIKIITDIVT